MGERHALEPVAGWSPVSCLGLYGYYVEYIRGIEWRSPIRWSIGGLYLLLYLATVMFYWWPLATIYKPLWYVYAVLFVISTVLNTTSHRK